MYCYAKRPRDCLSRTFQHEQATNGEEQEYRNAAGLNYIANYSKALPHNNLGEVVPSAYRAMVRAGVARDPDVFERIPVGTISGLNLTNPQAGLAFDLQGYEHQGLTLPPAPRIDGAENSAEMGELYWMALLRDVSFTAYAADPTVAAAATSLTNEFTAFRGPRVGGSVTPQTLFRGFTRGDLIGPYLSQFMLLGNEDPSLGLTPADGFISYGTLKIDQRQRTVLPRGGGGQNFLTNFGIWRTVQNGTNLMGGDLFDGQRRFIRNLRDLGNYVHFDALYEAYLNACLILIGMRAPLDPGNPYIDSRNQDGFGTFGAPHVLSLVTEVATRALKAVWFQKWQVHRRLRPEEFGGRIQVHRNVSPGRYPMINGEILASGVVPQIEATFGGSALLPQVFPEGAPTHPSYGAGHATVSGACVTVLKAWFDESFILPNPVVPDAPGSNLVPAPGAPVLTVGDELNKLAANIAIGRNAAGVHWRSDYTESVRLGEQIALGILRQQKLTYSEFSQLSFTTFDGQAVTV